MKLMVKSCVYFGSVMHMRLKPKRHLFRYSVFSLFLDIDKLVEFDKTEKIFSDPDNELTKRYITGRFG